MFDRDIGKTKGGVPIIKNYVLNNENYIKKIDLIKWINSEEKYIKLYAPKNKYALNRLNRLRKDIQESPSMETLNDA